MTVITDMKQTMANLKSAQANFETFALSTNNQEAKKLYEQAAKQTQSIIDSITPRIQMIEQEEPQYRQ
ncbi:DUF1657 domain-containing protein [Halobacillus halophilus]|uniref:DUF1657 domain-containing protein n=1 Tax=Halobacillus halophilus (strain ATCC 35676 / DSM 2266 / JCM 20832 / KCTC 3685 / LMG 17431 / NBRC 102448 / NCIMB 2269) TaxID=866895 RepID=I0JL54_HALH3|nr:DUF1657 domain-containing protein [Halobacillus halophilus]ASF38996.1 DUF1657 domain-containing protein [Halobacillus halophilus]CCG44874.1 hypothetical protein HBHAL_2529 [Halobacillus halophilus DSM 2266]